jgi:hypothetical protein
MSLGMRVVAPHGEVYLLMKVPFVSYSFSGRKFRLSCQNAKFGTIICASHVLRPLSVPKEILAELLISCCSSFGRLLMVLAAAE